MAQINKIDTDGNKGLLAKAEFGYDAHTAGGDEGRVYVGTGSTNVALATKEEAEAETVTGLKVNANTLVYTDELGTETTIDLSVYLDDSNLARLVGGTLDAGTGMATFTRDDNSTFTLDMSALLDDTTVTVIDSLVSDDATAALSAKQGPVITSKIKIVSDEVVRAHGRIDTLVTSVEW